MFAALRRLARSRAFLLLLTASLPMAAIRRSDRKRKCTERGLAALSEGTQLDTANAERGRPVRADSDVGSGDEAYVPELPWSPDRKSVV